MNSSSRVASGSSQPPCAQPRTAWYTTKYRFRPTLPVLTVGVERICPTHQLEMGRGPAMTAFVHRCRTSTSPMRKRCAARGFTRRVTLKSPAHAVALLQVYVCCSPPVVLNPDERGQLARDGHESSHCEKWLRKSHSCWKRLAEARYARMKSYYTAVSTSAAVLVGMLAL